MQEKKTTRARTTAKQTQTAPAAKTEQQTFATVPDTVPPAPMFSEEQVRQMIAEAVAKYAQEQEHISEPAQQLTSAQDGIVTLLWQAEVNDGNELLLGPNGKYGTITGKHAIIPIPKSAFAGDFRTTTMQHFLKTRNLIVVDGLTDEERKVYGVAYQNGEYLESSVYDRLIETGDAILEIFPKLHPTWREMVATKFTEAYENKKLKCGRDVLLELNRISRKDYTNLPKNDVRRKGGFYAIIHAMNAADETDGEDE